MKKIGLSLIVFIYWFNLYGQSNVVQNPSFEQYNDCSGFDYCAATGLPTSWNIPYWTSAYYYVGPDWFNSCSPSGVPSNSLGYQFPRSGLSYAGFTAVVKPLDALDYLEGQFSNSLVKNKKYCVQFFVSLGDSEAYANSAIGAYISTSKICISSPAWDTIPYVPQIENSLSNPITDKVNWVPISGEYSAKGGEEYIIIGKFDSITPYVFVGGVGGCQTCMDGQTYYYVDDVSVREIISAHVSGNKKDTLICNGAKILIGEDTAIPGVRYSWSPTSGLMSPNSAQTLASPSVTTTYTLRVLNDSMKGCRCPDSVSVDSITVRVDNFIGKACCNASIMNGQSVVLNSTPAYKYLWSPTTGLSCDSCQSVSASPSSTTTYSVVLSDSIGCSVLDTVTVNVEGNCGEIFVPDAFSPNGDGQNDVFYVKDDCIATFHMVIYDRWGNKVFETENISEGWDGKYRGKPEDAGTFVYYVSGAYNNASTFNKKGNITLVR